MGRKEGKREIKRKIQTVSSLVFSDSLQSLGAFLFNILCSYVFCKDIHSLFVKCLRTFAYVKVALKY